MVNKLVKIDYFWSSLNNANMVGSTFSIMVTIIGNGIDKPSSNPGQGFQFVLMPFGKAKIHIHLSPSSYE